MLRFDPQQRIIDLLDAHGALAQHLHRRGTDRFCDKVGTDAVFLDHHRKVEVQPLTGGKAFLADTALAASSNEVAVLRDTGLDKLRLEWPQKGHLKQPPSIRR